MDLGYFNHFYDAIFGDCNNKTRNNNDGGHFGGGRGGSLSIGGVGIGDDRYMPMYIVMAVIVVRMPTSYAGVMIMAAIVRASIATATTTSGSSGVVGYGAGVL
jgi:hypothetical protein